MSDKMLPVIRTCGRLSLSKGVRTLMHPKTQCQPLSTAPPSACGLSLQYRDDLAVLHMDNKQNNLRMDFLEEFQALLDQVENNDQVKALVTTGAGKYYSTGLDLQWLSQQPPAKVKSFLDLLNGTLNRILLFPIPTMAVLNGHGYAGGAIMAMAHDLRTMNLDKGWMRFTETIVNIPFSEFMLKFLSIKLGGGLLFNDAAILARKYNAEEAVQNGLVNAAFPGESQLDESIKYLYKVVPEELPRAGLEMMKKDVFKEASAVVHKTDKFTQPN